MHNLFENNLFNNDILIESQYVKIIHLQTPLGGDINFNSENIDLVYNYDVLDNKENIRNHIVLLELSIIEKKTSDSNETNSKVALTIVVEGIYNVSSNVDDKDIKLAKHHASLNLTINYLRTVFYNITSLTANGGQFLPLINIGEFHKKRDLERKKKQPTKVLKTKPKTTKNK